MKLETMDQVIGGKPFSHACIEDSEPLLAVLRVVLASSLTVLEIGSGTGRYAITFASVLSHLHWQTSDQARYHPIIKQRLGAVNLQNVGQPLRLDVNTDVWPRQQYDAIFNANILHIMSWSSVRDLFARAPACLNVGGQLICYGMFKMGGKFPSKSNEELDKSLRARDPHSGLRNLEDLNMLARVNGLVLTENIKMPENKHTLIWRKEARERF